MSKLNKRIDQTIRELKSKIVQTKMEMTQISEVYHKKNIAQRKNLAIREINNHIRSLEGMKEVE